MYLSISILCYFILLCHYNSEGDTLFTPLHYLYYAIGKLAARCRQILHTAPLTSRMHLTAGHLPNVELAQLATIHKYK